ncbi:hypothetical protein [Amycolatopsis methanolica]|uniref:hypothetical protein n=1 Tax=Amycolatopsis methanolica TaxID=1814 RepID=UPI003442312A
MNRDLARQVGCSREQPQLSSHLFQTLGRDSQPVEDTRAGVRLDRLVEVESIRLKHALALVDQTPAHRPQGSVQRRVVDAGQRRDGLCRRGRMFGHGVD